MSQKSLTKSVVRVFLLTGAGMVSKAFWSWNHARIIIFCLSLLKLMYWNAEDALRLGYRNITHVKKWPDLGCRLRHPSPSTALSKHVFWGGYISSRDVSYCFRMVWYRKIESVLCLFCFTQEKTWRIPFTSHQLAAQFSAMDSTALCIIVLPQRI